MCDHSPEPFVVRGGNVVNAGYQVSQLSYILLRVGDSNVRK